MSILKYFSAGIQKALSRDDLTDIFINENTVIVKTNYDQYVLEDVTYNITFILNLMATESGQIINNDSPVLETSIDGFRITATIPPLTNTAQMSIRRLAPKIYNLENYIDNQQLSVNHAKFLVDSIKNKKNILVVGGTGSGKTTFTNSLIAKMSSILDPMDRLSILEDTKELSSEMINLNSMMTTKTLNMTNLLKIAMRSNPDRIIVGEVRGKEALALLKAWNTGQPGGIATTHANDAQGGLQRLIDLSMEAGIPAPYALVAYTVNIVVFLEEIVVKSGERKRVIKEVVEVVGFDREINQFKLNKIRKKND